MRAWRRLIIVLVVLFGLFVAADRIGVAVAESQAAGQIQSAKGLNEKPKVTIEGFPFLTQVLAQKLDEVKLSANGLSVADGSGSQIRLQSFNADLHGVRLSSGFSSAKADSATGTAVISYADLAAALPHNLTAAYGGTDPKTGAGRVKLTGSVDIFGQSVQGTAVADLAVGSGDSIGLSNAVIQNIQGLSGAGSLATSALAGIFDTTLKITGLPVGLQLDQVAARADGVEVTLTGTNLQFTG